MVSILLCALLIPSVGWTAGSRSVTVQVSCTILPILEITTVPEVQDPVSGSGQASTNPLQTRDELAIDSKNGQVRVHTNLGNRYSFDRQTIKINNREVNLYSLTAL